MRPPPPPRRVLDEPLLMGPPGTALSEPVFCLVVREVCARLADAEPVGDRCPLWHGEDERVGREEISGVVVGLRLTARRVLRVLQVDVADLVRAREPRSVVVRPGHVVDDYLRNRKVGVVYAECVPGRGKSQPSLPLIEGGIRNDVDAQCLCDLADAHRVHRVTVVLEHLDDLDFNLDLAFA